MPYDDTPNWADVAWDHRAADAAMAALRRAAHQLERALDDERRDAAEAGAQWRGVSRAQFDGRRLALRDELAALAAACRGAASDLARASAQAAEEQRRRERAREEWERAERRRRSNVG